MKLYSTYVTAKSGTEAYTTALLALAEALGLTAQEAENAGDSIKDLTLKKMDQAVADAKTAIQEYDKNKGDTWFPKTYTVHFEEYSKDLITIVNKYKELYEMSDRDVAIFDTTTSLSNLITQYKAAEEMQAELRLFADQNGIKIVNLKPYMEVYLQETNDQYREALSLMEAYTTAEADRQVLRMSGFDDMRRAMSQLAEDGKVSESTLQEYAKTWDELIASIKDTDFEGFGKYVRESIVGILDKEFPQIAKYSKQWAEMMNADGSGMTQSVDKTADSVNRLAQALSTATKAKNAFDEAMKQDAENKGFSDYQSAYAAYAEEIEAGRVNSRRAMAAAKYLMAGSDLYDFDKLYKEKGYAGVNAAMKKGPWATVYGDAERTYGEGLVDYLDKIVKKNGELVDSNNHVIGSYKNVNGNVQLSVKDLRGLADATDMSVDQVWQAIKALSVYGNVDTDVERFTNALKAMGEGADFLSSNVDTGNLVVDYEKLRKFMSETGASESEWMKMKDWLDLLNEIGEVEI